MPLANTDLKWYRSSTGDSQGGIRSGTQITSGVTNNIWPDLNATDLLTANSRTRKIFIANTHGTDDWLDPSLWISVVPSNMVTVAIGLGFDDTDDQFVNGNLTQWSANAILQAVSDAADTRTLTIYGRDSSGDPATEIIALNGTTPVNSSETYSKVWAVIASAISGSRTVLLKQGSGGTTRGTLAPSFKNIWYWNTGTSVSTGILLPSLTAGSEYGIWMLQEWADATPGVRPNDMRIKGQET